MNTLNQVKLGENALAKVLSLRVVAFLIDYAIIAALTFAAYFVVTLLGFLTLGLGWLLYPIIFPIVALAYIGFTMGGDKQATIGMNMVGIKVIHLEGRQVDPLLAVVHTILFWFFMGLPLLLVIGLFTEKKQLLHDLLIGTVMVRS
jgi:uncharacterized RDD family membrane protein YckC